MNVKKGFLKFTLALSILVGATTLICHEQFFDENEVEVNLPENWKRMSTEERLNRLGGLLSKDAPLPLLSEIKQLNIRRQLRRMIVDKEDEVLRDGFNYSFGFHFHLGWEELSLLGLAGFASIWMLYAAVRVILLLIPSAPMIYFPSPLKPAPLPSVKIKLFGFLVLEEGPQRPRKPTAVWID
jgi:hypothetical protein